MTGLLLNDSYHIVKQAKRGIQHLAILDAPFEGKSKIKPVCQNYRGSYVYVESLFPREQGQKMLNIHSKTFCNGCKTTLTRLASRIGISDRLYEEIITARLPQLEGMSKDDGLAFFTAGQPSGERAT